METKVSERQIDMPRMGAAVHKLQARLDDSKVCYRCGQTLQAAPNSGVLLTLPPAAVEGGRMIGKNQRNLTAMICACGVVEFRLPA